jgi:hypothetical protein
MNPLSFAEAVPVEVQAVEEGPAVPSIEVQAVVEEGSPVPSPAGLDLLGWSNIKSLHKGNIAVVKMKELHYY